MKRPLCTPTRHAGSSIRETCGPAKRSAVATATRSAALLAAVTASLALGGCRQERTTAGPELISVQSFAKSWQASVPLVKGDSVRSLHLRGGNLFALTEMNTAFAIASGSGAIVHSEATTGSRTPIRPPLLIGTNEDRVIYPTSNSLEIFDNKTGRLSESIDLGRSTSGPGVAENDTVYIGLDYPKGGRFAAIDLTRKFSKTRWELQTGGAVQGAPAIFQNILFIPGADGKVHACNEQRTAVWSLRQSAFQTDGPITGDVKADEYGVYAASQDTKLYCLDRASGKVKWIFYAGAVLANGPVVTAASVYQFVPGRGVAAIDKTKGNDKRDARWVFAGAKGFLAEDDKHTYLRGDDNAIIAVDKQTGAELFRSRRNDWHAFATNTKDSTIYAATADGQIFSIKPVIKPGVVGEVVMDSAARIEWYATR